MKDFLKKNWWIILTFVLMAIKISMLDAKVRYTERLYETILASIEEQNGYIHHTKDIAQELLDNVRYIKEKETKKTK